MTIVSDGNGPYEDGVAGIRFETYGQGASYYLHGYESSRSVFVRFAGIPWKNENLMDIPPRLLPSRNCRIQLSLDLGNDSISKMEVGGRLEITNIFLVFLDVDTFKYVAIMIGPPTALYNQGHAYLVRESEDKWVLDVNTWLLPDSYHC